MKKTNAAQLGLYFAPEPVSEIRLRDLSELPDEELPSAERHVVHPMHRDDDGEYMACSKGSPARRMLKPRHRWVRAVRHTYGLTPPDVRARAEAAWLAMRGSHKAHKSILEQLAEEDVET